MSWFRKYQKAKVEPEKEQRTDKIADENVELNTNQNQATTNTQSTKESNSKPPIDVVLRVIAAVLAVIAGVLGVLRLFDAGKSPPPPDTPTSITISVPNTPVPTLTDTDTPMPTGTPTPILTDTPTFTDTPYSGCTGKPPATGGDGAWVPVIPNYDPSGKMGGIEDITIMSYEDRIGFIYTPTDFDYEGWLANLLTDRQEWNWKYVDRFPNPEPAPFGGVMYLEPPSNFGQVNGGYDLREFRNTIRWEARSLEGNVYVEFVIGGINWIWDEEEGVTITPPYPESLPKTSLGVKELTEEWQEFDYPLSNKVDSDFRCVIGGFGWIIPWGANGLRLNADRTGPDQYKTFQIEIRNIRYER